MRKLVPNFSVSAMSSQDSVLELRFWYIGDSVEASIPITGMMCLQTFKKTSVSGVPSGPLTVCSKLVICTKSELDMSG